MGQHFHLELNAQNLNGLVVEGDFTDRELEVLEQYLEQYETIASSPALSGGFSFNMKLQWAQDSAAVDCDLPDDDTLGLLLHRLRPFILSKEPASYERVSGLVRKRVQHPVISDMLKRQRRLYDGRDFQEMLRITIDGTLVNSEETLKAWLNSHEYHRDRDKRAHIESLLSAFPGDLAKGILVNMLIDKMGACKNLAGFVAVLLGKSESLTFETSRELMAPEASA